MPVGVRRGCQRSYSHLRCPSNASSKACFPDVWEKIVVAMAIPPVDPRTQRMVEISDFVHDGFIFIPLVQVQLVYGMAENLPWTSRYDHRTRVNTMKFTQ